ncbi:NTP transferase domain-containing protein [Pseudoalteromonas sp. SMS1]|uniref:sugar phosphate nucleotidyltransferase n=1 Tax=Pseudoalteromonas sp. SMS1 TaxID=2908894 RepID=UPI001F3BC0D2|nr:sugar phosphate nucleotidyltransferase [Pseudoalteromonas sp. SMS1]MCF2856407.1 NTP transferase domain-containing protein [Pseudoalteromonas sp. SMS1]
MDVIVLVGGKGTRLSSVVNDLPKPLAPIGNRPFFDLVLHTLKRAFGNDLHLILATGHMHHHFEHYARINHAHAKFSLSQEMQPLGTGGAIRHALQFCTQENVLVLNGDCYFDIDYQYFTQQVMNKSDISLAAVHVPDLSRFGALTIDPNTHQVTEFHEKGKQGAGYINAGVYLINKAKFMTSTPRIAFSFEQYLSEFATNHTLYSESYDAEFIDIGTPEDYQKAQLRLKHIL